MDDELLMGGAAVAVVVEDELVRSGVADEKVVVGATVVVDDEMVDTILVDDEVVESAGVAMEVDDEVLGSGVADDELVEEVDDEKTTSEKNVVGSGMVDEVEVGATADVRDGELAVGAAVLVEVDDEEAGSDVVEAVVCAAVPVEVDDEEVGA